MGTQNTIFFRIFYLHRTKITKNRVQTDTMINIFNFSIYFYNH